MTLLYYSFWSGPVIVSYTQRRKLTVVYSLLNHDCTTFTSLLPLVLVHVIKSYAPELLPMVYYRGKPRVQMFYFLIKQNKTDFTIIHLNISGF